jgi:hypothetical protein
MVRSAVWASGLERNVAGPDDFDRAIGKTETKRAIGLEPVEIA